MKNNVEYAVVVKNKTRLETLIDRFNTKAQARFFIEHEGGDFQDYEAEHETFYECLSTVQRNLTRLLKNKLLERAFVPSFIFDPKYLVVTVGQDGLVANTAKYAAGIPILAVNPDPARYQGVLLPFDRNTATVGIEGVLSGRYACRKEVFAEARLSDGRRITAFNDLFIGAASHVSARYNIQFKGQSEAHSSSGIIVSTRAGATGWFSSVMNMAAGIQSFLADRTLAPPPIPFRDDELVFVVREAYLSKRTQTGIQIGRINARHRLLVESTMPSGGVIFSDGMEQDFLHFNSGSKAEISLSGEYANLVQYPA